MKKIATILFLVSLYLQVFYIPVSADINTGHLDEFVYYVYLTHNNGRLSLDNKSQRVYNIIADSFREESARSSVFTAGVISGRGDEIMKVGFSVPDSAVPRGSFAVKAPYFANAGKIVFSDGSGRELLSVSVAESSYCNEDSVCNADVGENWLNCRMDCVKPAETLPAASPEPAETRKDEDFSFWPFLLLVISIVIVYAIGYMVIRRQKSQAVQQ